MAVSLDQVSTSVTNSGTLVTTAAHNNLTITGGLTNSALVVWAFTDTTATGLTLHWDSAGTNQLMTNLGSVTATGDGIAYFFGLRNPTSGNKTLTATWGTAGECSLFGASWSGVSQTSDALAFPNFTSTTGTSTTPSITVTSAVGDAVVAGLISSNTWATTNQTNVFSDTGASLYNSAGDRAAGASPSVTFSDTISGAAVLWAMCGVDIAASGAADILIAQACM